MINKEGKKVTTKPWQTKQWRDMRKRILGDCCTQCGSTKKPLVIQHLKHPPGFSAIIRNIKLKFVAKKLKLKKFQPKLSTLEKKELERDACPNCQSLKIEFVRKAGDRKGPRRHVCRKCGDESFSPIKLLNPNDPIIKKLLREARNKILEQYEDKILEEANKINQQYHDRYMSGKDATTFCKRCAFIWDKHRKKLCKYCKVKFHGFQYGCFNCLNSNFPDSLSEVIS